MECFRGFFWVDLISFFFFFFPYRIATSHLLHFAFPLIAQHWFIPAFRHHGIDTKALLDRIASVEISFCVPENLCYKSAFFFCLAADGVWDLIFFGRFFVLYRSIYFAPQFHHVLNSSA